ncbi:MAG TPA: hypothetical protein DEB10_07055 [Ruminococcaceae bacterium]|nr:hypothetical protein [Oscillospiraceae bacterium]
MVYMNAEIISVNSTGSADQFLKHELEAFGISLTHLTTQGCNPVGLREAIRLALSKNELVVIMGENKNADCPIHSAVSEVLGAPLELHQDSWERIQEFYRNTNRELSSDMQCMAMLPRGCTVFPNDHGSAPGCVVSRYEQHVLILPGTLSELMPMFSDYVAPYLTILTDGTIVSRMVGVFGLSEAVLTERLADLMSEANPNVTSYAKDGEAILRVTAHAADRRAAFALCEPVVEEIKQRLGVNVYGVDIGSLQKAVVALLLDKDMKIATAESCTAGLLSSRLTEVTGVSAVFECGIAAYSPEIKQSVLGVPKEMIEKFGTVSPEVAGAMAAGARRVGKAALGVGITGVAGPDTSEDKPVGTVYIALADEKRVWVKKISIDTLDASEGPPDRDSIRALATSHALDLVRRYLEALPMVMAGGEIIEPQKTVPPFIPHSSVPVKKRTILQHILPWKGDSRVDIVIKSALMLSVLFLFGVLLSFVYLQIFQPLKNKSLFRDLESLYDSSDPVIQTDSGIDYPEGMLKRFYALYARNPDVRGWVKIDDTSINYPIMQDNGDAYYKNRNYNRQVSHYGVPYFYKNTALISPSSINRSMVIYGNNTGDGQMFSDLTLYYNNLDFLGEHPIIEMNTIFESAKWKIFSVMALTKPDNQNHAFDYTRSVFTDEYEFLSFAGELKTRSLYNLPPGQVEVQEGDSLLLLSTNFEDVAGYVGARLVVAARKLRPGESESVDLSSATYNKSAVMPPEWKHTTRASAANTYTTSTLLQTTTSDVTTQTTDTSTTDASSTVPKTSGKSVTTTSTTKTEGTTEPEPSQTNSTTSTTPTSSTQPSVPPVLEAPPVLAGSSPESEFLADCKVISGSEVIQPKNKAELQMLLARVVKTEIGDKDMMANDLAAQKAQAIAAYTYILHENKTKSPYSVGLKQIDLSDPNDKKIHTAVGEVVGIKLLSNSSPIYTPYFSSSAGFTANNHEVNWANLPHLRSVHSFYENESYMPEKAGWISTYQISMNELKTKLEIKYGDIKFEDGKTPFYVRNYDKNGLYVTQTNAYYFKDGVKTYITGNQMRLAVGSGSTELRSHAFEVVSSTKDTLTFSVKGHGHGVGLSQWGAANYAQYAKWDYRQILSHYYSITQSSSHRLVYPVWYNNRVADIINTNIHKARGALLAFN